MFTNWVWVIVGFILGIFSMVVSLFISSQTAIEWWASFLQNIAAGFIGLSLALCAAYFVARAFLSDKLSAVAPSLLSLIQVLREEKKIDGKIAQSLVTFAVAFLSERNLEGIRKQLHDEDQTTQCPICGLEVAPGPCASCELPHAIWNLKKKEK